jgi:hypothetical protein
MFLKQRKKLSVLLIKKLIINTNHHSRTDNRKGLSVVAII